MQNDEDASAKHRPIRDNRTMDRSHVVLTTLRGQDAERHVTSATAAECVGMVWQLTLDAWAFKEPAVAESRFQRHAVRVVRGRG